MFGKQLDEIWLLVQVISQFVFGVVDEIAILIILLSHSASAQDLSISSLVHAPAKLYPSRLRHIRRPLRLNRVESCGSTRLRSCRFGYVNGDK